MDLPAFQAHVLQVKQAPALTRYNAALDLLTLRALGFDLPLRELGERWGVSHVTASRWAEYAETLPVTVSTQVQRGA